MSSLIFQFVLVIGVKYILCDRQLCADYVSDYEDQGFMCDTNHNCLVPMIDNLVDACLVGMFIENRDPDSISVRNETPDIDPVTKLMPEATVQPKNYTSYHPMYGYFSGYEEPVYHLGRLPMDPNELQTSFVVLDGAMNKYGGVNALTPETITQVTRDILYEKIYALAHDFNQDFIKSPYLLKLVQLLLVHETPPGVAQTSVAVVVVNWKEGAKAGLKGTFYRQAAVNTMMVGRQTGVLAYTLARSGRVSEANIHLIGYGLGAQLMHFAARWYTRLHKLFGEQDGLIHRVGRLTALDPAAAHFEGFRPLFGEWPHVSRLDALKVDMIVTSGGNEMGLKDDPLTGNYGMSQNVGLRTFYPNGGTGQPFCLNDYQPTDPLNDGDSYKLVSFCNHQKALVYFIYSLLPDVNRKLLLSTPQNSYMDYIRYRIREVPADDQPTMGIDAFNILDKLDYRKDMFVMTNIDDNIVGHEVDPRRPFNTKGLNSQAKRYLRVPSSYFSPKASEDFPLRNVTLKASLSAMDPPSCGKYMSPPENGTGRVFLGHLPYPGQFPWVVCIAMYGELSTRFRQVCTGAILDSEWILTAAHCFSSSLIKSGQIFYVTYGTADCLTPRAGYFRKVVFEVNNIVFFHNKWSQSRVYDVALIRLLDPIKGLPEGQYSGQLINAICLHTNQQYKRDSEQLIYYAGFGTKGPGVVRNEQLTWTSGYTTDAIVNPSVQDVWFDEVQRYDSDLYEFYYNDNMHTTCAGDSGGAYSWYVDTDDEDVQGVSKYRASVVSIVKGGIESCDFRYFNDGTGLGAGSDVAVKVYHPVIFDWIALMMSYDYSDLEHPEEDDICENWPRPSFDLS